ncbi:hypothetical protein DFH06DRAFT_578847 [Mycena polygramma]|nr:hypothetical protein DFH06DRAFT_578847 [Mycena polygramma]
MKKHQARNAISPLDARRQVPTSSGFSRVKWLTREEVETFVRPSGKTTAAVVQWLLNNVIDFTPASAASDWLSISIPASKASTLLKAELSIFTLAASGRRYILLCATSTCSSLPVVFRVCLLAVTVVLPRLQEKVVKEKI